MVKGVSGAAERKAESVDDQEFENIETGQTVEKVQLKIDMDGIRKGDSTPLAYS